MLIKRKKKNILGKLDRMGIPDFRSSASSEKLEEEVRSLAKEHALAHPYEPDAFGVGNPMESLIDGWATKRAEAVDGELANYLAAIDVELDSLKTELVSSRERLDMFGAQLDRSNIQKLAPQIETGTDTGKVRWFSTFKDASSMAWHLPLRTAFQRLRKYQLEFSRNARLSLLHRTLEARRVQSVELAEIATREDEAFATEMKAMYKAQVLAYLPADATALIGAL